MNDQSPQFQNSGADHDLSSRTFHRIADIALREAGLVLSDSKISMVKSRLSRRLRALALPSFSAYLDYLETHTDTEETQHFVSALTTNVSHFFRESHHFDYLAKSILPNFQKKLLAGEKIRIWSAGCSNGQEPYSIAMTLLDADPKLAEQDIRILATDIDPQVLQKAKMGQYSGSLTAGLSEQNIATHFTTKNENGNVTLTVGEPLRKITSFCQLNLHENWPMKGKFDLIFCRNVVIYFNENAQINLYKRYAGILKPGGWLILGHSERLHENVAPLYEKAAVTTYRTLTPLHPTTDGNNNKGPN